MDIQVSLFILEENRQETIMTSRNYLVELVRRTSVFKCLVIDFWSVV